MAERPYSTTQLASRWDVTPNTIRNMIDRKEIKAFKVGDQYRVPHLEVERIEECTQSRNTVEHGVSITKVKDTPFVPLIGK